MKRIILVLLAISSHAFSQNSAQFIAKWHDYYWNSPMIQNKYPDWPKVSIIEIQLINDNKIKILCKDSGLERLMILRPDQSFSTFVYNPNLLKPILFGMRADNNMVNIYALNTFTTKVTSQRIKGSLNPNINYIPDHIKY
jgi:hypothetical protein